MHNLLLPLFPLEIVLLPEQPLPLHIFEERYKEMIGECLERKLPFGVVRAMAKAVAEVGCTADIVEVKDGYGRNYLVPRGSAIVWSQGAEKQIEQIKRAILFNRI